MIPVKLLSLVFFLIILLSGILLTLPFFSRDGQFTPFIDSLFTTTSAVCVTGLSTVNTAEHWNSLGQFLIMLLIEIGGLGFMILPILFVIAYNKKVSLSMRIVLKEAMNLEQLSGTFRVMRHVIKYAVVIQMIGAVALSFVFVPEFGWKKGTWFSLFHAVSSFCNAGFDLFGDSVVGYQQNSYVLLVLSALIISGGLGFLVWSDLLRLKYDRKTRLRLHTKIALIVTLGLLLFGFILFFFLEKNSIHLVQADSFYERLTNTFFLSVTPRTAGFASIDYAHMTDAGIILTIFLMYIGGSSGSTAGGLKTTTFGVLLIKMKSLFKGRTDAEFAGRTIPSTLVSRALTLFFLTLSLLFTATMILSITETIPESFGIEYILFEVVSALGTVGLTMGLTPELTIEGKMLIMLLMYIGRVGIMTVGFSLLAKSKMAELPIKYPDEEVIVG